MVNSLFAQMIPRVRHFFVTPLVRSGSLLLLFGAAHAPALLPARVSPALGATPTRSNIDGFLADALGFLMRRQFFILAGLTGLLVGPVCGEAIPLASKPAKPVARAAEFIPADWVFIDNGQIRLGVKKTSGAGIGWLSRSGSKVNLLDHWDHGRLIQQSYYGKKDGSLWGKKPWSWNPVQGGDYKNHAATVLELTSDQTTLHARTRPRNWAGGELLTDCEMEETIRLEGAVAIVKFGFRYSGTNSHPVRAHEVPATFVNPAYGTMVIYDGDKPWTDAALTRSQPGWPNEGRKIPEGWFAWVNDQSSGVGVFSPIAKQLTCYRFGTSPQAKGACSYAAPLVKFAITPGIHFEYEIALALGTPEEMRAAFSKLKNSLLAKLPAAAPK